VISLTGGGLSYTENDAATQIDGAAAIADDEGNWNTGTLAVQITANSEATDRISIMDGTAGITLSGTDVVFAAQTIGTASAVSVTGNTTLTITFNGNATDAGVQAAARAMGYDSTSEDPSEAQRTVTFTVTDANSASNNDTQVVNVTAENDAPTISLPGGGLSYTENDAPTQIDAAAAIADDEGNWNTGTLTVQITANWEAAERISIMDGAAGITLSGTDVIYGAQTIGAASAVSVTGPLGGPADRDLRRHRRRRREQQ